MTKKVAVLIPCFNEEITIGKVVSDFRAVLPGADIYVFDNNSTDRTAEKARQAGAAVIKEKRQGKGFVVQSMFFKVQADIYIMVDGDDTYDLARVPEMVAMIEREEADMVVGCRLRTYGKKSFRPLHTFGNKLVRNLINWIFDANLTDIMSGLRVMNDTFVRNINIASRGFEVETEMSIKALKYHLVVKELDIRYGERPEGSFSKLNTFRDGILVLQTIATIFKDYKPLFFFMALSGFMFLFSLAFGSVVIQEYVATRIVRHVPLAILASGAMVLSIIFAITGIILDSTNRRFDELLNFVRYKR